MADERQDAFGHHVSAHEVGVVGTPDQHVEQLTDVGLLELQGSLHLLLRLGCTLIGLQLTQHECNGV